MQTFGIVEAQCARDGVEHAVGRSVDVAALKLGVVVRAHAGEVCDLLAAQPRHPSNIAVEHVQPGLLGRHPRPARHQELTDLAPAIHAPEPSSGRRRACAAEALRGAHSTPFRAKGGSTVKAMTKTWLITGAGRGMGVEFARAALAAGHNVVATGRNPDTVRSAVGEHENLLVTALDVTDPHSAEDAAAAAIDRFGRIDVLLNNAGSFLAGFFEELTTEQVRSQIETNLFGPMTVTRAVLPVMRRQHSGLVISISSGAGVVGSPSGSAYAASKFALEGWMESPGRRGASRSGSAR